MTETVGIFGFGSSGAAYAQTLALSGHEVLVWDRDEEVRQDVNTHHAQRRRYPGVKLDERIVAAETAEDVLNNCQVVFVCAPAQEQMRLATVLSHALTKEHIIVHASAGLSPSDGALLTDMWQEAVGGHLRQAVLGGPNFAMELIQGMFTALVAAAEKEEIARQVALLFDVPFVRMYLSSDMRGVQVCQALKNVLAIASGMVDGMGEEMHLGTNARAALLSRGLVEMRRLSEVMGGKPETTMGLAGMGDVVLHANSPLSRNYRFGELVGRGLPVAEAAEQVDMVEGVRTARMVAYLAASNGLDLAIVTAVDGILNGDVTPQRAYEILLTRDVKAEFE